MLKNLKNKIRQINNDKIQNTEIKNCEYEELQNNLEQQIKSSASLYGDFKFIKQTHCNRLACYVLFNDKYEYICSCSPGEEEKVKERFNEIKSSFTNLKTIKSFIQMNFNKRIIIKN